MIVNFEDGTSRTALIKPDDINDYCLRYLWIQYPENNDEFLEEYFKPKPVDEATKNPISGPAGLNVRARTKHLSEKWAIHNKIFEEAWHNGELIWRVKVLNTISKSIDYVEVWKSAEYLEHKFQSEDHMDLANGIFETGFDIRRWYPFQSISEDVALLYYENFINMSTKTNTCIITTPLMGTLGRKYDPGFGT